MVHYRTGRLSLKGSCSIRVPEVGGAGGAWRDGVSLCRETLPQAAGSLSALETFHHMACSGAWDGCSAHIPTAAAHHFILAEKTKTLCNYCCHCQRSNMVRLGRVVQSRKLLKNINCLIGHTKNRKIGCQ